MQKSKEGNEQCPPRTKNQEPRTKNQEPRTKNHRHHTGKSKVAIVATIFPIVLGCVEEDTDYLQFEAQQQNELLPPNNTAPAQYATKKAVPVPSELSDDPNDPDWIFDGYHQEPTEEEQARRKENYKYTDTLSDEEYALYKEQRRQEKLAARCLKAKLADKKCDERDDLLVTVLPNGQVWRLRGTKFSTSAPTKVEPYEGAVEIPYFNSEAASGLPFFADDIDVNRSADTSQPSLYGGIRELTDPARSMLTSQLSANNEFQTEEDPAIRFNVIGSDGRIRVYPTTGYPARTHGMFTPEGTSLSAMPLQVTCSGTKISARVVITAGHCLYSRGGSVQNRWWIPGADCIGYQLYGAHPTPHGVKYRSAWHVHPDWYDDASSNDDMGWFVLRDNQSSCDLGWLGRWDKSALNNDTVNLWGYPAEDASCADAPTTSPINGDCYASMYRQSGPITAAFTQTLHHHLDTNGGNSGSGLYEYTSGNRYVVGIHRAGTSYGYNKGLRLNSDKMDNTNAVINYYPSSICE